MIRCVIFSYRLNGNYVIELPDSVTGTKFNHLSFVRVGDAGEKGRRVVKCGECVG